jgi:hypothetical protein
VVSGIKETPCYRDRPRLAGVLYRLADGGERGGLKLREPVSQEARVNLQGQAGTAEGRKDSLRKTAWVALEKLRERGVRPSRGVVCVRWLRAVSDTSDSEAEGVPHAAKVRPTPRREQCAKATT